MFAFNTLSGNIRLRMLLCIITMLATIGQSAIATAADGASPNFKPILKNTVEDLWTGREFKPKLISRQKTLKTMLVTGQVKKPELEDMLEKAIFAMLNRHQTSRYILKTMPERVNSFFSPHMNWEEVQRIMWRALSSVLKKDDPILFKAGTLAPPGHSLDQRGRNHTFSKDK